MSTTNLILINGILWCAVLVVIVGGMLKGIQLDLAARWAAAGELTPASDHHARKPDGTRPQRQRVSRGRAQPGTVIAGGAGANSR